MRRSRHHAQKVVDRGQIATLVERHSRYVLLARVKSKDTGTVINALIKQAQQVTDLESWQRDGGSQTLHPGYRHQGLLL